MQQYQPNLSNHSNNTSLRSNSIIYDYETAQQHNNLSHGGGGGGGSSLNGSFQQRTGSIKHNGHAGITVNAGPQPQPQQQQHLHHPQHSSSSAQAQAHWKSAAMNGFSPANLNSSARSRGPFVTHVTLGPSSTNSNNIAAGQQQQQQQPTYQTVHKHHHQQHQQHQQQHQQQQQSQYSGAVAGPQHTASKV